MTLADVRDYIASLNLADHVYMGKLPDKEEKSIGVYNSKHQYPYHTAIGGPDQEGYGQKYVTFLVHWNKSPRDTEKATTDLFEVLRRVRDAEINKETIKFNQQNHFNEQNKWRKQGKTLIRSNYTRKKEKCY